MDSSLTSFTTSSCRSKIKSWVSMGIRHFHHPTESVVASAGLAAVENTHPQSEYTVCSWPVSLEAFSDHVKQLDEWAGSVKVPNTGRFTSSDVAAEPTHKVVPMSSFLHGFVENRAAWQITSSCAYSKRVWQVQTLLKEAA